MNLDAISMEADGMVGVQIKTEFEKREMDVNDYGKYGSELIVKILSIGTAIKKVETVAGLSFGHAVNLHQ